MNARVDAFLSKIGKWEQESHLLRKIALDCGLVEEFKWSKPCYTFQGSNVVVIQGFKAYCALLFFKGVLMDDPHGVLTKTGDNTRVGRQIRFTSAEEIAHSSGIIKSCIREAIRVEKSGKKTSVTKVALQLPAEFKNRLKADARLKAAFGALTPGRQRAYAFYFSGAKQSVTRESRIEKSLANILSGKGLNE